MIHGFITSGGQKMSKSLGNVVNPFELVKEYGTDAVRYWLLRGITPFEDGDFTLEKFQELYNSDLANGIGNLTARILKMASANEAWPEKLPEISMADLEDIAQALELFEFDTAARLVWSDVARLDQSIQENQPFKLVKTDPEGAKKLIQNEVAELWRVAHRLAPFLPGTAARIQNATKNREVPPVLFPRK
jgi:methionyl-tRNA synthetase